MATVDQIPSDLAIEIDADLPPNEFMAAARHFFGYVDEVAKQLRNEDGDPIRWTVKVSEGSSVLAAVAPISAPPGVLSAIYGKVGEGIDRVAAGEVDVPGISEGALGHLKGLSDLTTGRRRDPVPIRVWIEKRPKPVVPDIYRVIEEDWRTDYRDFGSIEGRLEAIQEKKGLQIQISDVLLPRAVRCILPEELLRSAFANFRKRVEVAGVIHYRKNGTPVSISASGIEALPDDSELPTASEVRGILRGAWQS